MIAQYRPDIAKAVEETVVNLKQLESFIDVVKNDLAWVCQSVGHPEAARVALTPSRSAAYGLATGVPSIGSLGFGYWNYPTIGSPGLAPIQTPFQNPFQNPALTPFGIQGQQPFGIQAQPNILFSSPYMAPFGVPTTNPFAVSPTPSFR